MIADVQDIVFIKNMIFENGKMDLYSTGRPVIIIGKNDEYFYYLSCSSSSNKKKNYNADNYYILNKKITHNHDVTFIDLRTIYKKEHTNYLSTRSLSYDDYVDLLDKLYSYQNDNPCELFNEFHAVDKNYVLKLKAHNKKQRR